MRLDITVVKNSAAQPCHVALRTALICPPSSRRLNSNRIEPPTSAIHDCSSSGRIPCRRLRKIRPSELTNDEHTTSAKPSQYANTRGSKLMICLLYTSDAADERSSV